MSVRRSRPDPLAGHPKYEKIEDLSSGSFGIVMKARNKQNNREYAIKFLPRGNAIQRYVLREILNHRVLRHPHVVQFFEVLLVDDYLGIVMEYADKGDLFTQVQEKLTLSEDFARWIFQQLIFGLDYCHRKGVANRDIKLENVLLQAGNDRPLVKLCDFGYSKHEDWDSAPRSKVGTPDYMAPEIVSNCGGAYNAKAADLWSCGVVLYVMLVGQYPFSREADEVLPEERRVKAVLQRILSLDYQLPSDLSPEGLDLLKRLLTKSPEDRATIEEVMHHSWYSVGLPPQALKMNDVYLKSQSTKGIQSEEDAIRIVEAAMRKYEEEPVTISEGLIDAALEEEEASGTDEDYISSTAK
eukprot:g4060.t1